MDNIVKEMEEVIKWLNEMTKYYDEGNPQVSDKEWDDKYFELVALEEESGIRLENSPTQSISYDVINALEKVVHDHPMLSLSKTKSYDEMNKFINDQQVVIMEKMDGLTVSLHYSNGKLVDAETRGNGEVGERILHNAKVINNVPKSISFRENLVVDGEVICDYDNFELWKAEYSNPRNMASGVIRLLDAKESAKYGLKFVAWDVIKGFEDCNLLSEKLDKLAKYGFTCVDKIVNNEEDFNLENAVENLKTAASEKSYPIDGVVVKYDNVEYYYAQGKSAHDFAGGKALKFYDEEFETKLRDIVWQIGRTSLLSPVAIFDEIDLNGAMTDRASLSNIDIIKSYLGKPYRGQNIRVARMNMVIPKVVWGEKAEEDADLDYIKIPMLCPCCNHTTEIRTSESGVRNLYCSNPLCEGILLNKLTYFVGKNGLDIRGLSDATLLNLIRWGWVGKYEDIFYLSDHRSEWIKKAGFSITSVDKILNAIETAKDCELWRFISSIGIPLVGPNIAKEIAKKEETWSSFKNHIFEKFDFSSWNGFGIEICSSIIGYNYEEIDKIANDILRIKNSIWSPEENGGPLTGINVCITGGLEEFSSREEMKDKIEALGGKVVGGVSKKTTVLVNNDLESTSSKNAKAKELGIPIINEKEFIEKYLNN